MTVLDRNGDPIWGASVILYDENWNTVTQVSTDSGGVADLGIQPQDEYNVEAYLSGEFLGGINICHDASSSSPTLRRDSPYATSVVITDEGDGDGVHEQGEMLTISPSVYNAEDYALDLKTRIIVEGDGVERFQNGVGSGEAAWFGRDFTPSDGGTYSVTVEVYAEYSGWQLTDTVTTSFEVNRAPEASVSSPDPSITVAAGSAQTFTARGTDPDGNLRGVEWYLDGNYRTVTDLSGGADTASWTHAFDSPGTYLVEGLVFDEQYRYDADAATWTVEVCAPRIETSPSDVDMGQFSAEDRETVRIDIVNAGCGDLEWDVSSSGLFTVVDRGADYLVVRTSDGVYGDFDAYVEVVALNDVVEADGFARTRLSGTAAIEAEPPIAEYINPTGTSSYVGRDMELRGGASPGSDGVPADQFPAATADELVFVWEIDGTEVARSKADGSGGVPAVDTISHEFNTAGDHTVTLRVEDPVSGKSDTISEQGYTIEPVRVTGTVTHAQLDEPLSDVTVDLGGQSTTTTSSGEFSFEITEAGTYTLSVDRAGYEPVSRQVDVDAPNGGTVTADVDLAGEPVDVAFNVQKKGSIEAYDWFGGEPLPDANVTFDGETRQVDDEGRVVFEAVEPGVHTWNITAPGWGWNNGSRAIYGSERNLEISAGVAPSGSGVLEIHPMNGSEEVPITSFDVYVDEQAVEPNVETNRVVLTEGLHTLKLVPTDPDSSLKSRTKNVEITADQRTTVTVDVSEIESSITLSTFETHFGQSNRKQQLPAGFAFAVNATHTGDDGDGQLVLATGAGPGIIVDSIATGFLQTGTKWEAESDGPVRVEIEYELDGRVMHRNADCFRCNLGVGSFGGISEVRSSVLVYDRTDDKLVNDYSIEEWSASTPGFWSVVVDVGFVLVGYKLGKLAEAGAGTLATKYGLSSAATMAAKIVGNTAGDAIASQSAALVKSDRIDTTLDRHQSLGLAFDAEAGHEYIIAYSVRGYVFSTGVVAGSSVTNMSLETTVHQVEIRRGVEDVVAPEISIMSRPNRITNDTSGTLRLEIRDDVTPLDELEYQYRFKRVDETPGSWSPWITAVKSGGTQTYLPTPGEEGNWMIQIRARDASGNIRLVEVPITVDTEAPTTEITTSQVSGAAAVEIGVTVSETNVVRNISIEYRPEGTGDWHQLDLRSAIDNETRKVIFTEDPGTYDLRVRATDAAGNVGTWTQSSINVPDTNRIPKVRATASQLDIDPGSTVTLRAEVSDEDDDFGSIDISWKLVTGPVTVTIPDEPSPEVTLPEPGSYTFEVTVVDDDGASDSSTVTVQVDEPQTVVTTAVPTTEPVPTLGPPSVSAGSATAGTPSDGGDAGDLVTEAEEKAETLKEEGEALLTEAPGQPGFGPVSLVVALVALVLLLRRRQPP